MKNPNKKYEPVRAMSVRMAEMCEISPVYVRAILRGDRGTRSEKARKVISIADELLAALAKTESKSI